jgi:hypothetical protein
MKQMFLQMPLLILKMLQLQKKNLMKIHKDKLKKKHLLMSSQYQMTQIKRKAKKLLPKLKILKNQNQKSKMHKLLNQLLQLKNHKKNQNLKKKKLQLIRKKSRMKNSKKVFLLLNALRQP